MMVFVVVGFLTLIGVLGAEIFSQHEAVSAGLQQCKVGTEVLWQKECL